MKLIKPQSLVNGVALGKEQILKNMLFKRIKFTNRTRPKDKNKILIITNFSEFGCETLGVLLCIPHILKSYPNLYVICVGWFGRSYLYKHLCDEFWEADESFQFLREYSFAFKNSSLNIKKLEQELKNIGYLYPSASMGNICIANVCRNCKHRWSTNEQNPNCPKCCSSDVQWPLLNNIYESRKKILNIPSPSNEAMSKINKYIKPRSVGIFARARKSYGRNLDDNFYVDLIKYLKDNDYNPIWLGERQSVLPCPVEDITDFSYTKESNDLELTLALISKLDFTIQFWTASTRLASMVGTPWILFESPQQIVGEGHEGLRIALTSEYNKKKLVLCNYKTAAENISQCFSLLNQAIVEINQNNWNNIVGLVHNKDIINAMLDKQNFWRSS